MEKADEAYGKGENVSDNNIINALNSSVEQNLEFTKELVKLRSENAKLKKLLEKYQKVYINLKNENRLWKARWEKLRQMIGVCPDLDIRIGLLKFMIELESSGSKNDNYSPSNTKSHYKDITIESGGESSPSDGSKAQDRCRADGKLASGEPKPDSLSLCQSCGCMTKTIHDEEVKERCGKCGKEKEAGQ